MSDRPLEDLEGLLARKLAACEAFLSSTRALRQALEGDDDAETDRQIDRRAGIIAAVALLDRQIDRHRPPLARRPQAHPRLEALFARIGETIRATVQEDESCAAAARSQRETLKAALATMGRTKAGLQRYGDMAPSGPRFLNLRT